MVTRCRRWRGNLDEALGAVTTRSSTRSLARQIVVTIDVGTSQQEIQGEDQDRGEAGPGVQTEYLNQTKGNPSEIEVSWQNTVGVCGAEVTYTGFTIRLAKDPGHVPHHNGMRRCGAEAPYIGSTTRVAKGQEHDPHHIGERNEAVCIAQVSQAQVMVNTLVSFNCIDEKPHNTKSAQALCMVAEQ